MHSIAGNQPEDRRRRHPHPPRREACSIKIEPIGFAPPKYDWRELRRWDISESNLPPGSEILFREPGIWERYRWQMALMMAVFLRAGGFDQRTAA